MSRGTRGPAQGPAAFRLRGSHPLWPWFPPRSAKRWHTCGRTGVLPGGPHNPRSATAPALTRSGFGLVPVRSPLLRESRLISSPRGTKMFQFPRFPSRAYGFRPRCESMTSRTLPHSGIPGSTPADGSPRLFAAYHALHRLLAPRHPPCALPSATPAPSRALPTPALAPCDRSPSFASRYAVVPVLVGRHTATHRRAALPRTQPPSKLALGPPLRPTKLLGRPQVLGGEMPGTQKPAARARRPVCRLGCAGASRCVPRFPRWAVSLSAPPPCRGTRSVYSTARSVVHPARGGAGEIRTPDLPRARRALSH